MTTFKATVMKPRSDGFYTVFIRVTHARRSSYIMTDKIIDAKHITTKGELTDPVVNEYCAKVIRKYGDRLNRVNNKLWTAKEVVAYLQQADEEACFSEYARDFIAKMKDEGHERNAKNYLLALGHLERFIGTTRIMFNQLSSSVLNQWLKELSKTSRAKEMYPTCLRQVFKSAERELNDEERDILPIKFNPWTKVKIPKSDNTVKKAISAEACREFFNRPLPKTKMISPLPELGRDVALLSLCLFNANVNIGIREICYDMGMTKENKYCFYTFRHTWATIAQNDCDANLYEVAFGTNHSHGFNVTRGYIKIDFSPAWALNAKVIDFIFFSTKKSKQGHARDLEAPKDAMFRLTRKMMVYVRAYFKGDMVAEMTDIGFDTVDDVIAATAKHLPSDIPVGCVVQFRIKNCDSQREIVYERSKGKGF